MQGVVIAGTHSGCGKTTMTLGIMAALHKKGHKVQPFKVGPDFIDTGLHKLITGRTSRNLDLWMCGTDYVKQCFQKNMNDADFAVIEGVMGMYDGSICTADLAAALELPVILVVDAYGMAESAGAVVKGFVEFGVKSEELRVRSYESREVNSKLKTQNAKLFTPDSTLSFAGVIFNRVASERHYSRIKEGVQDIPVLGYLPRTTEFNIPHRHLGLTVAEENPIGQQEIDKLADAIIEHIDIDLILRKTPPCNPPLVRGEQKGGKTSSCKIAVAYDKAFCFYYEDNLDLLKKAGAEIITFSPLSDRTIPEDINALYIGGGYPELHAEQLSANKSMLSSIRKFSEDGMPVYAECGGFIYLTGGIYDFDNILCPMAGVFPFKARMLKGRSRLGYREVSLKDDCILGKKGSTLRGHEFHYSEIVIQKSGVRSQESVKEKQTDNLPSNPRPLDPLPPFLIYSVKDGSGTYINDEGYRVNNTIGSYIHIHFGSNKNAADNLLKFCNNIKINLDNNLTV